MKDKKVHLIGICGKGMSGLALMLKQKGYKITGSDEGFYEPVAGLLKKNKINFKTSYKKENIPKDADLIIIGKHAKLMPKENEEVKAAFASGKKIQSLPEALGDLADNTENTLVVGNLGKSTITALLAWCLEDSKKNPSYFIGAVPFGFKSNARLGKGKQFIFEGDEYSASNWDNTSKFLYLRPKNLIFTSAEHDHINFFPTEKDYIRPYDKLISIIPENGLIVANSEGKNVAKITEKARCRIVNYSLNKKYSWHAENILYGIKTSFDLYKKGRGVIKLETSLLGNHNIENIIGASTFLLEKHMLTPEELQKSIRRFSGISGRLDLKTKKSSVLIYEGYGSSYSKAKSVFEALKLHFPDKKLITIFEPYAFSWRNKNTVGWYDDIFDISDEIIILSPPEHGKKEHEQIGLEEIIEKVKKSKEKVYGVKNKKEAFEKLEEIVKKDDLIILMSSGDMQGLIEEIPLWAEKKFPK